MKLDRETRRRLILFALLEAAVLLVLFGALFAGYTVYTRDSRERAALDLAEDYATSLSSLSYDALAEGDAPIGNGCFYAVYALRGDGEYEMDTPYALLERLKPGIGGQTDAIDRQTFAIDSGGEYTFLTYTTELEAPDRTCYLKIFIPSALADEMLTGAGNAAVPFVVAFVVIALASAFALGYIQVRPLLISYGKQKAFVNDMSHEIRTPLAIIRGNLDNVLAGDGVDDASRESLRECVSEVEYMTDISAGLLNIVRAGNRNVGKDGNVSETVSSVVDMYADLANMDDKALIARIDSTQLSLDRDKVKQLVSILLDNAVKYTRPGDRINVKLKNTARGGCALVVADTGIGVPKGDEEKIFDRFYRASNVGEIQGTGLGLAIAKTIVESLGGTIAARANAPSGLEITVDFPRR